MNKLSILISTWCLVLVLVACGDGGGTASSHSDGADNRSSLEGNQELENTSDDFFKNPEVNDENRAVNRENMTGDMMSEKFQAMEGMEDMDMETMMAMRENMDMSDKAAMRENMGLSEDVSKVFTEGFGEMTEEERENLMENQRGDNFKKQETGMLEVVGTFKGKVTDIVNNEFFLVSEEGIEKTVTIPKDLVVANGDYTRILLGMNLFVGFNEEDVVVSVAIVQ